MDCKEGRKPAIVLDYNRNKVGFYNLDQVVGMYSCKRMTAHWPLVLFYNIINVSTYNAFVIWQEIDHTWTPGKINKRRISLSNWGRLLSPHAFKEGNASSGQKSLWQLWKVLRRLNLVLAHQKLQLGAAVSQSEKKGASGRRTARQKLWAAHVRNTSGFKKQ